MASGFICEENPSRAANCPCGAKIIHDRRRGPKARYCSQKCRNSAPRPFREFTCAVCSSTFLSRQTKAIVCGRACQTRRHSKIISEAAKVKGPPAHRRRICSKCGIPFVMRNPSGRARRGLTQEGLFCSRFCRDAQRTVYSSKREAKHAANRRSRARHGLPLARFCICGAAITHGRRCKPCAVTHVREQCRAEREEKVRSAVSLHAKSNCKRCSAEFVPIAVNRGGRLHRRVFCSAECCRSFHRDDVGRNHRKRARYFGVPYEPVNPVRVLERDRYRCMICGVKTPRRLRGTIQPNAPELDHRVPLAAGGGHTWDNVQCACRRCNLRKGGKRSEGQMTLFNSALVARS